MNPAGKHYLEDLEPGERFACPHWPVTEAAIQGFAREYDPQPFHLDRQAAKQSMFAGLAASGWHTGAMMMGMATRSELQPVNGHIGMGVEAFRFTRPVRPGDTLTMTIEVLSVRRSGSHPAYGVLRVRWVAYNQHQEIVAEAEPTMWLQARSESGASQ